MKQGYLQLSLFSCSRSDSLGYAFSYIEDGQPQFSYFLDCLPQTIDYQHIAASTSTHDTSMEE